ncbi:cupin [Flavobacteriaceae bacterium F89]|uniref:Cupin n=1 Tax=Cerina litoralis TaxID=2874477 RepID=A0AAE3EZG5_9FLAO|nr:cupin [Cerina litoralis]MCG2462532.1 cupin [Cerina litoralis]
METFRKSTLISGTTRTRKAPQLKILDMGDSFQTLQMNGQAGMVIPFQRSTEEAAIAVLEGLALLQLPDTDHFLKKGSTFIVPAGIPHSLNIIEDFKAIAVMNVDSEIQFQ